MRAFCSASVRLGRTRPPTGLGPPGRTGVTAAAVAAAGGALPATGRFPGAAGAVVSALGLVATRLFTFSTTTALVRPWLKLWRTTPCSTPRPFRLRVLVGATLSFFSPVFSVVSAIPIPIRLPILGGSAVFRHVVAPRLGRNRLVGALFVVAGRTRPPVGPAPETVKARGARQERIAFGTGKQGCMYHICPPQCQIQLR